MPAFFAAEAYNPPVFTRARHMLTRVTLATLFVCVGAASGADASRVDTSSLTTDYRITAWAGGDGITLGEVRDILQDRDGYLWIASDAGLVRFDGFRFTNTGLVTNPEGLPIAATRAIHLGRDGSLWVGYGRRDGIYRIKDGVIRDRFLEGALPGLVNTLLEDRAGVIWAGYDGGLTRYAGGVWHPVTLPGAGRQPRVRHILQDRQGTIWVGTLAGLYRSTPAGDFRPVGARTVAVRSIAEDDDGRIWVTDGATAFRPADRPWEADPIIEARGMGLFHDSRGNFWVTTIGQGIWQLRGIGSSAPRARHANAQAGLVSDENSVVFEDRDGNIWVGSLQGLNRLSPHRETSLLDMGMVLGLAVGRDGSAWASTPGGLMELDAVTPNSQGVRRLLSTQAVRALHTARDGVVWAATPEGLHRVSPGHIDPVSFPGTRLDRITAITSDRQGTLSVSDEREGVVRLTRGRAERLANLTRGAPGPAILLHTDHDNRVWAAFAGGTVRRLESDGRVVEWGTAQGLDITAVSAIYEDGRGDLWAGGEGGLALLRGERFHMVSLPEDLAGRWVSGLADDDSGGLWVAVAFFGLIHIDSGEVGRIAADPSHVPRYRVVSAAVGAGFPSNPPSGNASQLDGNRALWLVTSRGLAVFDPREARGKQRGTPSPARIESIVADERHYLPHHGVTLPPRTSRVRIDYTAISLGSLERIRFRYRLDGFDDRWIDGTGPRQALYTNLSPGEYRFRLQSTVGSTGWSNADVDQLEWTFVVEPTFYQTGWFQSLVVVFLIAGAAGAWQMRLRHVRREVALVFSERLRLSREIHDTLLQSLYGIALQLDVATQQLQDSASPLREHLARLRRQTEDYIAEARRSIWDLRARASQERDFLAALRDSVSQLTAGRMDFSFDVGGTPRPCPSRVETQIFRIGHEAVMNAVRHSHAGRISMAVVFGPDSVRLQVTDDGHGFDAAGAAAPGHYGLMSMRERAADVGGRCTITSRPGQGVQVVAEFPLSSRRREQAA